MHSFTYSQDLTCVPESNYMSSFFDQEFLVAKGLEHLKVGRLVIEDALNLAFAGDVLDLSAAEVVAYGELHGSVVVELRNHGAPDVFPDRCLGRMELNFEKETPFEGTVQVACQVSGGNKDAVEFLHLFEDDVLHGVFHPFHRAVDLREAASQQGVSFV